MNTDYVEIKDDFAKSNSSLKKEITHLKRELKRKDQLLLEKNTEIQNYLYSVTHELKTPIVNMRGYSELLNDFHQSELNQEIIEYLKRVSDNVDRMEALINDLLVFARININFDECELLNIGDIIKDAILEIKCMTDGQDVDITVQDNLPVVFCHKNLLIRVFTNLLSNAIKYSNKKNEKSIKIGYYGDEIFHKFFVKDNGIGIPADQRDKLFKLFSRLPNSNNVKGSGLGLAISKRIIDGHGGEIWVESSKGKGAIFYFTLPRR